METLKRTFLGMDVTPRKELYIEIDALTEENREQVKTIENLKRRFAEREGTITSQSNRIKELKENIDSYVRKETSMNYAVASKDDEIEKKTRKIADLTEVAKAWKDKYDAAVKYQENTQAAYDELKTAYDQVRTAYDLLKKQHEICVNAGCESKNNVAEADAVPTTKCDTAQKIGFKSEQPRGKDGRFGNKHKR